VEDGVFTDPNGKFSVPVPTNWTVALVEGIPVLVDPDGDLRIALLVLPSDDPEDAIDRAWTLVYPEFDRNAQPDVITSPSGPGIDETLVVTDDYGTTSGEIAQAIALQVGDEAYVLLATGSLDAAIQRASQTQIILGGFSILQIEATPVARGDLLPFSGALVDEFETYVADLQQRLGVPGAAVAIVVDGEVVYADGYGVTDLESGDAIGPDTYMMIGSTTKSMTTMMMASAIDDGAFTWDTPAVNVYPDFAMADPALTSSVTMRNLVCACTGVPRQDLAFALNGSASAEEVLETLSTFEVYTGFGEAFQYSNQMVAAGGYIAAHGDRGNGSLEEDYLESMQVRVFDPIGMTRTTFDFGSVEADQDHATPHGATYQNEYVPIPLSYEEVLLPIAPAGAVWSTANDMGAYLITQMQRGLAPNSTNVVSAENLTETWQPQVQVDATTDYGLGWLIGESYGQPIIFHDGNTFGFTAKVAFLPESQVGIVVLANAQTANLFTEGVSARFFELINGQPPAFDSIITEQLDLAETQIAAALRQVGERPSLEDAAILTGTYTSPTLGNLVVFQTDEGALMIDTGEFLMEARPFAGSNEPALVILDPPFSFSVVSIREVNGTIELVIPEGTDERVFTRAGKSATPVASPVDM
jgi:CubicO group peptidase (beta-lactamase class C family)